MLHHRLVRNPWGILIMRYFCPLSRERRIGAYRVLILLLTFITYTSYHLSRKPISVVKPQLLNCTKNDRGEIAENGTCYSSYIDQFNNVTVGQALSLEGTLDGVYLISYAFFMFFSGIVAERVNLRYFLSFGCILSGIFTILFGLGKYWGVKSIYYYIVIQFFGGAFQTTGWPGVVTVVANWFGDSKKGLIFGIWNSHTSVGNILGSLIAGNFVNTDWGLSFIVPAIIIISVGIIIWLFLVPRPEDVDLGDHHHHHHHDEQQRQERHSVSHFHVDVEDTPLLESIEDESSIRTPSYDSTENINSDSDDEEEIAIGFFDALKIPGVVEFSLCLFFAKLVSYTFLYWLPTFIKETGHHVENDDAAKLSTFFDIGGIAGGIIAGLASDYTGKSATTCAIMLIAAIPMLFAYESYGQECHLDMQKSDSCYIGNIGLLVSAGVLVNGPYALITTAVSAQLGRHPSLSENNMALATVTSIIDGTGSVGAAIGPLLAGAIHGLNNIFYMLMASDLLALMLLSRLVMHEIKIWKESRQRRRLNVMYQDS